LTRGRQKKEKGGGTEPTPFGGQAAVLEVKVADLDANALLRASSRAITPQVGFASLAASVAVVGIALTAPSPAAHSTPAAPPQQQLLDPQSLVQAPAEPAADLHHTRASGRIGDDLSAALQAAGVPEHIGREYVGLMSRAFSLGTELSVEDKFDLVYEPGADGRLLFAGLDRVGRADLALLKWTDGKSVIWVNADGAPDSGGEGMQMPVSGPVTSRFGSRFHPILGHARMHRGVDLRASAGSPIVAAAGGRVVAAGWRGGYGRQVAIAHGDGIQTTYSHMSRIAARAGETVRQGQVIGYVGSSGLSTGPHLHYEVYKNGRAVNPLSVKFAGQPPLANEKLHAVRDALRGLLAPSSPNS
jgi:murein DD-endopeptidase MepM/ murein hydrolase activator NlpD